MLKQGKTNMNKQDLGMNAYFIGELIFLIVVFILYKTSIINHELFSKLMNSFFVFHFYFRVFKLNDSINDYKKIIDNIGFNSILSFHDYNRIVTDFFLIYLLFFDATIIFKLILIMFGLCILIHSPYYFFLIYNYFRKKKY